MTDDLDIAEAEALAHWERRAIDLANNGGTDEEVAEAMRELCRLSPQDWEALEPEELAMLSPDGDLDALLQQARDASPR